MRIASADDGEIKVRVDNSWREFLVGWGIGLMTAGLAVRVHSLFAPVAPPLNLWVWSGGIFLVVVLQLTLPTAMFLRRPGADEVRRIWSHLGPAASYVFGLSLAGSVWFLLPYASDELRLLMCLFYLAACCWQVITASESLGTLAVYAVAIMGSAAVFFLREGGVYGTTVGVFMAVFGLLLVAAAATVRETVRGALAARLAAEQAASALEVALDDARAARAERERFMAAASHDLRQPLQAATLFFREMVRTRDRKVKAQAQAGVALAFEETDALLQRMLDYLRLDARAVTARLEATPVARLFARAVAESASLAGVEGVTLKAAETGLWVRADVTLAAGVLRNFVHNALHHAHGRQVRLLARQRGDRVRLYVLDDGAGVADEARRAGLFEPYVQGPRSAQERRSGLGLGLASARRMADLMGGAVDLDPAWRGGAAFYLDLARAAPQAAATPPRPAATSPTPGRRVLVLDDDEAARRALAGMFTAEGWTAEAAATSEEACGIVRARPVDLVVCDWRLGGGVTGDAAVRQLRRLHPGLPALLITGDGSAESHTAIAATGLSVLFKPTPPARILEVADRLCRQAADGRTPVSPGLSRPSRRPRLKSPSGRDRR